MSSTKNNERSVFCAVVGVPNVGKSTLLNGIIGARVAITSPRPQTTRNRIMGVVTKGEAQYVFADTPGYHLPRTRLAEHMVKSVRDSFSSVDCTLFVTRPKVRFNEAEQKLLDELSAARARVLLVINKTDTVKSADELDGCERALRGQFDFAGCARVCALTGDGFDRLLALLDGFSQRGPHLYPDDTLTDVPEREIAAELVREQLLRCLRDELPHGCAVTVERWAERGDGTVDIDAEIVCEKRSHKGMIIGRGGSMLKKIGTAARLACEDFLDARVNLKLFVKVREDWRNKESFIKDLGL